MKTQSFLIAGLIIPILLICSSTTFAQELKPIQLLAPQLNVGKSLMQVLNERQSSREFSSEKLPLQVISNLLWAAWGVNRSDSGKRTAPSASNMQEIDIYVTTADGLYLYNAQEHMLEPILAGDIRADTGTQDYVGGAAMNLVYVADYSKMGDRSDEDKRFISAADTGFISQNVYLYCASEGLATVVRGLVDQPALEKVMKLEPGRKVVLAQSVGYPKK